MAGSLQGLAQRIDVLLGKFLALRAGARDVGEYMSFRTYNRDNFDVESWCAGFNDMNVVRMIEIDQTPRLGTNPHGSLLLR